MRIEFTVLGKAQPAGSKRAFAFKRKDGGLGATVTDANPKSKDWKRQVAEAAYEAFGSQPLLDGPLKVTFVFYRPRPAGHFGKKGLNKNGMDAPFPISRPDVLKLARGIEDSLSAIIYVDDSQIVDERLVKVWGEPARVEICIEDMIDGAIITGRGSANSLIPEHSHAVKEPENV